METDDDKNLDLGPQEEQTCLMKAAEVCNLSEDLNGSQLDEEIKSVVMSVNNFLDDDNSDADFEEVVDDAVEVTDCSTPPELRTENDDKEDADNEINTSTTDAPTRKAFDNLANNVEICDQSTTNNILYKEQSCEQASISLHKHMSCNQTTTDDNHLKNRGCDQSTTDSLSKEQGCDQATTDSLSKGQGCDQATTGSLYKGEYCDQTTTNSLYKEKNCDQATTDSLSKDQSCDQSTTKSISEDQSLDKTTTDILYLAKSCDQTTTDSLQKDNSFDQTTTEILPKANSFDQTATDSLQKANSFDQTTTESLQKANSYDQTTTESLQKANSFDQTATDSLYINIEEQLKEIHGEDSDSGLHDSEPATNSGNVAGNQVSLNHSNDKSVDPPNDVNLHRNDAEIIFGVPANHLDADLPSIPSTRRSTRLDFNKNLSDEDKDTMHEDSDTVARDSDAEDVCTQAVNEKRLPTRKTSQENKVPAKSAKQFSTFQQTFENCIRRAAELPTEHPTVPHTDVSKSSKDERVPSPITEVKQDSTESWKIDYIMVEETEEQEEEGIQRTTSSNSSSSSRKKKKSKSKKSKDSKKKTEVKIFRPPNNLKIALTPRTPTPAAATESSPSKLSPPPTPVDWSKLFSSSGSASCHALFNRLVVEDTAPSPRVAKATRYASPGLAAFLQATCRPGELESHACPGCGDSFLIPSAFFQHIHRRSVLINLTCRLCQRLLTFTNKCLLRMHVLSHTQATTVDDKGDNNNLAVSMEDIDIISLDNSELRLKEEDYLKEHRKLMKQLTLKNMSMCMECLKSMNSDDVPLHLSCPQSTLDSSRRCDQCHKCFPSRCSLTSHMRIHEKKVPYVCPECGREFCTWSIFKVHLARTCFHDTKVMVYTCRSCPTFYTNLNKSAISHTLENHTKPYFQCSLCNRAFSSASNLKKHCQTVHKGEGDRNMLLFRSPVNRLKYFKCRKKLEEHLESEFQYVVSFGYQCNHCQTVVLDKSEFERHVTACRHDFSKDQLYNDKPVEDKYVEVMDDLRRFNDDLKCRGCLKHGRSFRNHIDKHHTVKSTTTTDQVARVAVPAQETPANIAAEPIPAPRPPPPENVRQTRNMKRSLETESASSSAKRSRTETSPLKMKIKIVSEDGRPEKSEVKLEDIDKGLPDAVDARSQTANSTATTTTSKGKSASKVKFNEPPTASQSASKPAASATVQQQQTLVFSTLGIDVPSDRELIEINQLDNRDAFVQGSTVSSRKVENTCLVCGKRFKGRTEFQQHIQEHSVPSTYQCKECGASFASEPSWRRHLLLIHRIRKPSPDMYCWDLRLGGNEDATEDEHEVEEGFERLEEGLLPEEQLGAASEKQLGPHGVVEDKQQGQLISEDEIQIENIGKDQLEQLGSEEKLLEQLGSEKKQLEQLGSFEEELLPAKKEGKHLIDEKAKVDRKRSSATGFKISAAAEKLATASAAGETSRNWQAVVFAEIGKSTRPVGEEEKIETNSCASSFSQTRVSQTAANTTAATATSDAAVEPLEADCEDSDSESGRLVIDTGEENAKV